MGSLISKFVFKNKNENLTNVPANFWDIDVVDINGHASKIEEYKGQKLYLVVNVASACGLTDANYRQLKKFHDEYKDRGLYIMGFPCN